MQSVGSADEEVGTGTFRRQGLGREISSGLFPELVGDAVPDVSEIHADDDGLGDVPPAEAVIYRLVCLMKSSI